MARIERDADRNAYLALYEGQAVSRKQAESSHPSAYSEIKRLLSLGRVEVHGNPDDPDTHTISFSKPVEKIGEVAPIGPEPIK